LQPDRPTLSDDIRSLLSDVLGIAQDRAAKFTDSTELFGSLPELDSMAVANLLAEMEDRLGIIVEADEVDGDMLGTFGGLVDFVSGKLSR
jgi:acyl carrier protein